MEIAMPWTETIRPQYRSEGLLQAGDVTEAESALVAPHLQ
jgi:hypothetical protein